MSRCIVVEVKGDGLESLLLSHCQQLRKSDLESRLLLVSYPLEQYWLEEAPLVTLSALYLVERQAGQVLVRCVVKAVPASVFTAYLEQLEGSDRQCFDAVCEKFQLPSFALGQPVPLKSVRIAKPWGQEIWYTGVEQRGVATAGSGSFQSPLPHVLSAMPGSLGANSLQSLILLKILDPLPDEVFGDLYFELHQEKREVYVVTHVDRSAWPGGVGGIRFGFDPQVRRQYRSDQAFKVAFSAAVKAYEQVRREIDRQVDGLREQAGVKPDEPVAAKVLAGWLSQVPASWRERERQLRADMESFIGRKDLRVGDVVKVPCFTPHSLQHGVRTVEFQTPVYERLIVSFAQKVLTQSHWDTDRAVEIMSLETSVEDASEVLLEESGALVERIVDFEDFEVRRIRLDPGADYSPTVLDAYGLLMAVDGEVVLSSLTIAAEQAVLLPSGWQGEKVINTTSDSLCFLLALPK